MSTVVAPPRPSKWDIIPLHTSDRATFKACRRRWAWSSPSQANLAPKASVHGIRFNLWFGTGIHYALEKFYQPGLSEDPTLTFEAWFNLQWEGGVVRFSELGEFIDRNPRPTGKIVAVPGSTVSEDGTANVSDVITSEMTYAVAGLQDILPDPDYSMFEEHKALGIGMMNYYKDYAAANDNFTVIATEHNFSVPVFEPVSGEPLYMVDTRVMPDDWEPDFEKENTLGPLMRENNLRGVNTLWKQVHARGRMDMIIQDNDSGMYGIIDHKTAATIGEDYFRHLDLDEQCTTYLAAARIEATMYDLPYKELGFITYQALRKNFPKPPTMTSKGLPSYDRQKEGTTAAMFEKCIKDHGLQVVFETHPKLQEYYTYLMEQGDKLFIERTNTHRNKHQVRNAWSRMYLEAMDMLDSPRIYPNPRKELDCLNCAFRAPCIGVEDGSDYQVMIDDGYVSNHDR